MLSRLLAGITAKAVAPAADIVKVNSACLSQFPRQATSFAALHCLVEVLLSNVLLCEIVGMVKQTVLLPPQGTHPS